MEALQRGEGNPLSSLLGEGIDMGLLMKLGAAMGKAGKEPDPRCELLFALKPFLRAERRERVEEAAKILRFLRIAALFKEGGF